MQELHSKHVDDLKELFKCQLYLSSTTDLWSCKTRSFLGVSIHFIDTNNYALKTYLIACEQFEGTHNAFNTAEKLKSIYNRFEVMRKIVATTTDNGGEFVASFKHYGNNNVCYESYLDDKDVDHEDMQLDDDEINDVRFTQILPIPKDLDIIDFSHNPHESFLTNDDFHIFPIPDDLPNRVECSAHGLNLCGNTDAYVALENESYATIYCSVFKKLNLLWHYASCRKTSEIIVHYLGRTLTRPNKVRWNYIYDSVSNFYDFSQLLSGLNSI